MSAVLVQEHQTGRKRVMGTKRIALLMTMALVAIPIAAVAGDGRVIRAELVACNSHL